MLRRTGVQGLDSHFIATKCPNLACRSRGAYVTGFVPHYETFTQKPIVLVDLSTGKTKYSQYSARQKPL